MLVKLNLAMLTLSYSDLTLSQPAALAGAAAMLGGVQRATISLVVIIIEVLCYEALSH